MENEKSPYKGQEKEIMDCLGKAWSLFLKTTPTHTCHTQAFADGIHKCQDVIIHRIVQRDYPGVFPTHKLLEDDKP